MRRKNNRRRQCWKHRTYIDEEILSVYITNSHRYKFWQNLFPHRARKFPTQYSDLIRMEGNCQYRSYNRRNLGPIYFVSPYNARCRIVLVSKFDALSLVHIIMEHYHRWGNLHWQTFLFMKHSLPTAFFVGVGAFPSTICFFVVILKIELDCEVKNINLNETNEYKYEMVQ